GQDLGVQVTGRLHALSAFSSKVQNARLTGAGSFASPLSRWRRATASVVTHPFDRLRATAEVPEMSVDSLDHRCVRVSHLLRDSVDRYRPPPVKRLEPCRTPRVADDLRPKRRRMPLRRRRRQLFHGLTRARSCQAGSDFPPQLLEPLALQRLQLLL